MVVFQLTIGCTKEKTTSLPEVKEYFASKETNVKEEIRNFLLAAGNGSPTKVSILNLAYVLQNVQ